MVLIAPGLALWVTPVSDIGGVGRHVLDVAQAGLPGGWELAVLMPEGPMADRLAAQAPGVRLITAAFGPSAGLQESVRSLRRAVRDLRPDVVHTHLAYADIVASLCFGGLPRGRRPLLVTTEHGIAGQDAVYHSSSLNARAMAAAHGFRLRRTDLAIAVSAATRMAMTQKWHAREVVVIPNGVDAPSDPPPPRAGLRVLALTRFSAEKRIELLLDGFAALREIRPEATLTLAGDGPARPQVERAVADRRLTDAVDLPGFVDAQGALRQADVLVQMSVWENCSYSLLDAAALGLGVVASDVGGNPEFLPRRCLVAAEDAQALAEAITRQGLEPRTRPGIPAGWPDVRTMCGRITAAYDETTARMEKR